MAFAELVQVADMAAGAATTFRIGVLGGGDIAFVVEGNLLRMYYTQSSTEYTQASVLYSATSHRWLRVREYGGQLFWDTSADGTAWVNYASAPTPYPVDGIRLWLMADRATGSGTPGATIFDNVNGTIAPATAGSGAPCSIAVLTDDFNDNRLVPRWSVALAGLSTISEAQALLISTPGSTSGTAMVESINEYSLTGASLSFEATIPATSPGTITQLGVRDPVWSQEAFFEVSAGTLTCISQVGTTPTTVCSAAYDTVAHRFLRFVEAGGIVTFQASSNGTSFNALGNSGPLTFVAATVWFALNTSGADPNPVELRIDNVKP
jgi:hypothetical protein